MSLPGKNMPHLEGSPFERNNDNKTSRNKSSGLGKRILKTAAFAAVLAAGQELKPALAQEPVPSSVVHKENTAESKEKYGAHPAVKFNGLALDIMTKTEVKFRGNGLYLFRSKKEIDLSKNGSVVRVEIVAEGQADLLVKITEKPESGGGQAKVTELRISHGFLQESPGQKPKE